MLHRPARRVVVVGTGGIARVHADAIAATGGRAELVAAVDADAGRAAAFAAEHDVTLAGTDLGVVLEAARADGGVDLAHVCTPPGTHAALAAACLRAGVPVLLEKPPAVSLAELDDLAAESAATGVGVGVVFQHRFGAGAARARALLDDPATGRRGPLGRPLVATCDTLWFRGDGYFDAPWRGRWDTEGGGPTMGHGIHQMDMLLSILGPWTEVTAMAGRQARPTATEDASMAVVRFASGALASVVTSLVSPRETSAVRIDAERATVEVTHLYGYREEDWVVTAAPGFEDVVEHWRPDAAAPGSGHGGQLAAVLDALDAGAPLPVPLADTRPTLELVAAIYASAFTGAVVRAGDIVPGHPFYARMDGTGAPWLA